MSRHLRHVGPKSWLLCAFAAWLVAFASARATEGPPGPPLVPPLENLQTPQNPPPAKPPAPAQAPAQDAKYVGQDTCVTCHDNMRQGYEGTPHHRASDPRSPGAKQGCETCHGPGSLHAENPTAVSLKRFRLMSPDDINDTCTTCHNRSNHALWDGSQHEARGLSCTTCHSVNAGKSELFQLKEKTQRELCATCHRDKVSKLDRSGHMPVREGKLECSSCHNPHGATNVRLLRKGDSISELCASCHADKRGPFLWEHAPVRESCVTCHDPHGSSNERMLVAKAPFLCQRCHNHTRHPATIYDTAQLNTSNRIFSRSCATCHTQVHGSNHPSGNFLVR
jgi:DmsE family decaheme c-type cytochrome